VHKYLFQVLQKPTGDQKQKLAMFSKKVAAAVTELIQTAEAMKGNLTHRHTPSLRHIHIRSV